MSTPGLVCTRCGVESTYADAYMLDREKTCEEIVHHRSGMPIVRPAQHDWTEQLDPEIDVV
jgi:hypothetical protein